MCLTVNSYCDGPVEGRNLPFSGEKFPHFAVSNVLLSDCPGGSAGFIVGHVAPEAQVGGPIALVQNGDRITIDAEANTITIDLSDDELARRRKDWKSPPYKATRGTLYKYIKNVKSASEGCVTDE